ANENVMQQVIMQKACGENMRLHLDHFVAWILGAGDALSSLRYRNDQENNSSSRWRAPRTPPRVFAQRPVMAMATDWLEAVTGEDSAARWRARGVAAGHETLYKAEKALEKLRD